MENTANIDEINKEIKETLRNLSDKYSISLFFTSIIDIGDKYVHTRALIGNLSNNIDALLNALKTDYYIRQAVFRAIAEFGIEYREEEEEEEEEE